MTVTQKFTLGNWRKFLKPFDQFDDNTKGQIVMIEHDGSVSMTLSVGNEHSTFSLKLLEN